MQRIQQGAGQDPVGLGQPCSARLPQWESGIDNPWNRASPFRNARREAHLPQNRPPAQWLYPSVKQISPVEMTCTVSPLRMFWANSREAAA